MMGGRHPTGRLTSPSSRLPSSAPSIISSFRCGFPNRFSFLSRLLLLLIVLHFHGGMDGWMGGGREGGMDGWILPGVKGLGGNQRGMMTWLVELDGYFPVSSPSPPPLPPSLPPSSLGGQFARLKQSRTILLTPMQTFNSVESRPRFHLAAVARECTRNPPLPTSPQKKKTKQPLQIKTIKLISFSKISNAIRASPPLPPKRWNVNLIEDAETGGRHGRWHGRHRGRGRHPPASKRGDRRPG